MHDRWWEFYGIRYGVGTVVGALIVHLIFSFNSELSGLLLLPDDGKDLSIANLILMAAYGLTFCLISSAPVLVFHLCRGLIYLDSVAAANWKRGVLIIFAIGVVAIPVSWPLHWVLSVWTDSSGLYILYAAVVPGILFSVQVVYIFRFNRHIDAIYDRFYEPLARQRAQAENTEFIESYRHLREHGNSFFILVLEWVLASVLFFSADAEDITGDTLGSHEAYIMLISMVAILWAAPAAGAWFSAQRLESLMVRRSCSENKEPRT